MLELKKIEKNKGKSLVINEMINMDHEQVVFCQDKETKLKAIIAIQICLFF